MNLFCQGMSYDTLPINAGDMPSPAWLQMIRSSDSEEKERLRQQLLEYCRLDTYGMVMILEEMQRIAGV